MQCFTTQSIEAIAAERRPRAAHARHTSAPVREPANRRAGWLAVAALAIVVAVAACSTDNSGVVSPVSEDQAIAIADNALRGFNERDYAVWARDWSETMKSAIGEAAFLSFRDQYHAELGDYVAITDTTGTPGDNPGVYRWAFDVEFTNAPYRMVLAFKEGSGLVEGIHFEAPAG